MWQTRARMQAGACRLSGLQDQWGLRDCGLPACLHHPGPLAWSSFQAPPPLAHLMRPPPLAARAAEHSGPRAGPLAAAAPPGGGSEARRAGDCSCGRV